MSDPPPLQRLFTLPFALHLQPLPELSYVRPARHADDGSSSDSSAASDDNAVGAGANKLEPRVQSFPPHPLETISFLLQHTDVLNSVPGLADLLALLDAADPDPSFATLRAFFDARYDEAGLLVGSEESQAQAARRGSLPRKGSSLRRTERRKPSFVSAGVSPGSPPKARTMSTSTSASGGGGFKLLPKLRRKTSSSRGEADTHDGSASEADLHSPSIGGGGTWNVVRAPEIVVLSRTSGSSDTPRKERRVRFGIRLDLHSVNLAPQPRGPTYGGDFDKGAAKGADTTLQLPVIGSPEAQGASRLRSPSLMSKDLSLRPVNSIGSVFSQSTAASDAAREGRTRSPGRLRGNESQGQSASPTRSKSSRRGLLGGRSLSAKSQGASSYTLDSETLGTSPETYESFGSMMGTGSISSPAGRKPSTASDSKRSGIISRLLDFGGRQSSGDQGKGSGRSALGIEEAVGEGGAGERPADALVHETGIPGGLQVPPELNRASARRGPSSHSDISNDDALDTADDESSLPSSVGWSAAPSRFGAASRRRSSASGVAGASGFSLGVVQESELRPLKEGHVLAPESVSSRAMGGDAGLSDIDAGMSDPSSGHSPATDRAAFRHDWVEGRPDFLTLLRQASERALKLSSDLDSQPLKSEKAKCKQRDDGSSQEPTPGGSLDLARERLEAMGLEDAATPRVDHLAASVSSDPWWPSGRADPLPLSFAAALSQAFGWEGVLNLCYGVSASAAAKEQFIALGKAAELEERIRSDSMRVKRWALDVSRSAPGSPKAGASDVGEDGASVPPSLEATSQANETIISPQAVTESLDARLAAVIDGAAGRPEPPSTAVRSSEIAPSDAVSAQLLAAQERKASAGGNTLLSRLVRRLQGKVEEEDDEGNQEPGVDPALSTTGHAGAGEGTGPRRLRGWSDWSALAASMAGWVEQYESTRVRHGLAREIGMPLPTDLASSVEGRSQASPNLAQEAGPSAFQIAGPAVTEGILQDLTSSSSPGSDGDAGAFRRRAGIPEGLATGVNGEEFEEYRWSRANLEPLHFGTAMLLTATSISHFLEQLSTASWCSTAAWELDYLEMLVFRSPLVAERFPPPSGGVVPARQCFNPTSTPGGSAGETSRACLCPNPAPDGSWDATAWRDWLSSVRQGQILVPAVSWQAWWTLISILNGADGSGRPLDLQVKSPQEPFETLTDMKSIYI